MLERFLKKDRNEILESVLEQKDVDEKTKNLLQGILYKIDVSYKDYQKAKVIQRNKKEYVDEINKNNIIDYFKEDIQIFITTTDIKDINDELKAKSDIYVVDNGNFNKEE